MRKNRGNVEEWVFCFDDVVVDVTRAPITGCRQPRIPRLPSGSRHFRRRPTRMSYVASWFKSIYTLDSARTRTRDLYRGKRSHSMHLYVYAYGIYSLRHACMHAWHACTYTLHTHEYIHTAYTHSLHAFIHAFVHTTHMHA